MASYETLGVTVEDGIATVTFDAVERRNALDERMAEELLTAGASLAANDDVRCLVLTHEGAFFGTGADLSTLEGDASDEADVRRLASMLHDAVVQFHSAAVPVVGGVDGVAAGAGFSLALLPDVLLLSEDAQLEFAYPRIGLTGDGGSTFFLPRLVGLRAAKEIALLDEPIGPDRARELGLATEVVGADAFEDRLGELATTVASGPTAATGATMELLTRSFDRSLEAQLAAETDRIAEATRSEDYSRGLAAFFGDEPPEFVGR